MVDFATWKARSFCNLILVGVNILPGCTVKGFWLIHHMQGNVGVDMLGDQLEWKTGNGEELVISNRLLNKFDIEMYSIHIRHNLLATTISFTIFMIFALHPDRLILVLPLPLGQP